MACFTGRTIWGPIFPKPRLKCRRRLWKEILHELRERGQGNRESGGFLLGRKQNQVRTVEWFIPYDIIDPDALRGYIMFDGSRMDMVWEECRRRDLDVVADVHTHPGGFGQSAIDRANPMIPERGHIALIIPNLANRLYLPGNIGIYEFRGREGWMDMSAKGRRYFVISRFW
jgi:proteasome lid subunit RPN8/RPN11